MLTIANISKQYSSGTLALNSIDLQFDKGLIGILGPNGAGKTTLLKIIVGNLKPTQGYIIYDDYPISINYPSYCATLGYMPQSLQLYPNFTVQDFLQYMANCKGLSLSFSKEKINTLCETLCLQSSRHKKIKHLSSGTKKRIGIAQALLNEPKLLVLDEPTAELDPKERIILLNLLSSLSKDHLILYSTHIISDIEHIATQIVFLHDGRIHSCDTYEHFIHALQNKVFEVHADEALLAIIQQKELVIHTYFDQSTTLVRFISDTLYPGAVAVSPTLDDVYLSMFQGDTL